MALNKKPKFFNFNKKELEVLNSFLELKEKLLIEYICRWKKK